MGDFVIRRATEDDFAAILGKIKALALFEKAPEKVTNTVEKMKAEQAMFGCFVAEVPSGEMVGIALYYYAYYTWVGKSLYLDDLFVDKAYRGKGLGKAFLKEIFKVAKSENCQRVRWQVLDWNQSAIEFYKKQGACIDKEWYNCTFDRETIEQYDRFN